MCACEGSKTNALFELVRLSQAFLPFQRALWKIGRWGTGDKGRPAILLGAPPRLVPRQKAKNAQWSKTPKPLTFSPLKPRALHFRCLIVKAQYLLTLFPQRKQVSWWRDSKNWPPENRDAVMTCKELSRCCLRPGGVKLAYKRLNTGDPHRDGQPEPQGLNAMFKIFTLLCPTRCVVGYLDHYTNICIVFFDLACLLDKASKIMQTFNFYSSKKKMIKAVGKQHFDSSWIITTN